MHSSACTVQSPHTESIEVLSADNPPGAINSTSQDVVFGKTASSWSTATFTSSWGGERSAHLVVTLQASWFARQLPFLSIVARNVIYEQPLQLSASRKGVEACTTLTYHWVPRGKEE